jgi:DNA-binding LacI/PurR family transcriptional regulator
MGIRCEYGTVKKIILEISKRAILIHSPAFTESAREIEDELKRQGYIVYRLNTGVKEEEKEAERLLSFFCE